MLKNPYEKKADKPTEMVAEKTIETNVDLDQKFDTAESADSASTPLNVEKKETISPLVSPELPKLNPLKEDKYSPKDKKAKLDKRSVEQELTPEQYHERLTELNNNAENKHYVLFLGKPASGKTWIIGSILHYMKNYLGGMVYLDTNKTTYNEEELFYQLQNRFNGVIGVDEITSTDTTQYFEFHISFTPKDSNKPPIDIVFIDCSGEHSQNAYLTRYNDNSGKLPNYLTAILESNVNTKLAFVYDQSLEDKKGEIPQANVLNAVFTEIQHIQNNQKKYFPKVLLLSKADRIYKNDNATLERCGNDEMTYALEKIPSFANSFFNESIENKANFYNMGTFSNNSDLILEFNKECPEKLFRWLYMNSTGGNSPIKEPTCWDKLMNWFKGK
ncbi:ribonucleoside-triphosphate reductase [Haemophilus paracuniculus]|uniref:Ribonucleoside-triphosphate reductase n=1 Tax=Haemophilus paracuniculus TaxID=734 RepID=A0A1T0AT18_9PAST|nr:ATP-binding protein [Haemophilus paracuniculus]OOR99704.1 ribonucleoside-triphosphate reductase [Haemophilus paracuniculus]